MASLVNCITEISAGWSEYKKARVVDKDHSVHRYVTRTLPLALSETLSDDADLKVQGSVGLGNVTAAPWIATFDTRITKSAASGYYVVYLFSVDMKFVYLCFGLGATQFAQAFSRRRDRYEAMDAARERLLDVIARHLPDTLNQKMSPGDIDLGASSSNKLHRDYECANVLSLRYPLSGLPSEDELLQDYSSIVSFYRKVAGDPLTPDPLTLLKGTSELEAREITVQEDSFSPRERRTQGKTGSFGSGYSKTAKIVGDAGELAVLESERRKLTASGRADLAQLVVHEEAEGSRPGWDITSYEPDGQVKRIEVKSCEGKLMNALEITRNEWKAASEHLEDYYIYLVTEALSQKPKVEVLRNPYALVQARELTLEPQRYVLDLRAPR